MSPDTIDPEAPDNEALTLSTPAESEGLPADGSGDDGDLTAGRLIAERFRIVGRLGSGGMGVVYRADDLVLGTSVALKFLPPGLVTDPVRLERLRSEVRLARRVAHPNVCRVYDIGDAEGRPFLSMEYIDGEDLASLLRRIGRLPRDKAVELAREICAGVAAAHELGVIHRDLKPANVMIDGRGRARVADFGLAAAKGELGENDAMAGTPAYMAPEQLQGAAADRSSDIYSLGLLLYELFTGNRAHKPDAVEAAVRGDPSSLTPTNPSDLVDNLDPQVERVLLGCLADDPGDRPVSVLGVLAALPGGDPLAAVLRAGEMPSPELVAASGRPGSLPVKRALLLGAITVVSSFLAFWIFGNPSLGEMVGGILDPEVMEFQCQTLLADLGHDLETADSAWGIDLDWSLRPRLETASAAERRSIIASRARPVLHYWYRSSPAPMSPWYGSLPGTFAGNFVRPVDPPLTVPGMAMIRLAPDGRLIELRVVPQPDSGGMTGDTEALLAVIAAAAGLDSSTIEPMEWTLTSPMPGAASMAWRATESDPAEPSRRITITMAGDLPTWVRIDEISAPHTWPSPTRSADVISLVFFGFFIAGAVVGAVNVRAGRWDRRGSVRLALAAFVLCLAAEVVASHHSLNPNQEVRGFFTAIAYAATRGLMTWLLYIAIEPFIRKLHPRSMVSWSRLLAGRLTDPAVGRDVLIGLMVIALQHAAIGLWSWTQGLRGTLLPLWAFGGQNPMVTSVSFSTILRQLVVGVGSALGFLLIYVVLRRLAKGSRWLAPLLLWLLFLGYTIIGFATGLRPVDLVAYGVILATGATYLAVRHGLLAFTVNIFISQVAVFTIFTFDPANWYFPSSALFIVLVIGLTAFGVKVSAERSGTAI